jgi:hypothetical protein
MVNERKRANDGQRTTDNGQRAEVQGSDVQGFRAQRAEKDEHRTSNVQHRMVNERKRANDGQRTTDNGQRAEVQGSEVGGRRSEVKAEPGTLNL